LKHSNSEKKSEPTTKRAKSRGPMQRDTKEVLAELVEKLKEKLDPKKVAATSAGEKHQSGELRPNLDRLTVGVGLGDQGEPLLHFGSGGGNLADEFLRRFLLHVSPASFVRIRYFGLLANRRRAQLLNLCRSHLQCTATPQAVVAWGISVNTGTAAPCEG
jgi:hypothetical protein